jgi:hypothetical protein
MQVAPEGTRELERKKRMVSESSEATGTPVRPDARVNDEENNGAS